MKFSPHEYQERVIQFMVSRGAAGILLEPGLGKTSCTLAALKVLRAASLVRSTLIIAPLRVTYSVWPAEVQKWDDFQDMSVGILHGPNKDDVLAQQHDIYVMNYEGLPWLERTLARRRDFPFDVLVCDESSKLKSGNTQRFKTLKKLLPKFKRRYILTGSPAPNSLLDVFFQFYVMDMGATFGPYITHFRNTYYFQTGYGGYEWKLKPGAEKAIHALMAPRALHLAAEDYIKLPPLIETDIILELPGHVRKVYDQMENQLRADLDSGQITAANSAVAAMKCRQIANGGLYSDAALRTWEHLHDAKTEALVDLIEELEGQPTLVAYDFTHDLDRIKKALGKDVPHIGSGVSPKRSQELVDAWNRGEIPVLLGHPQSLAHGINMQKAGRAIIWYSLQWSWENYMQFVRRIWRQGQTEKVFVYHLIMKDTVDEAVMAAIKTKKSGEKVLLTALNDYWKRRK